MQIAYTKNQLSDNYRIIPMTKIFIRFYNDRED